MRFRAIPAGIEWRREGRQRWTVIVRQEPEIVAEWEEADFAVQNAALAAMQNAKYGGLSVLPWSGAPALLGGIFGGMGT